MINTVAQAIAASQQNSRIGPLTISDSEPNVLANLDGLQTLAAAGNLASLTFADDNYADQIQMYLTASQLAADAQAIDKLFGVYSLPVTGTLTAVQAAGLGLSHATALAIPPAVADTAANLAAHFDTLEAMAAAGRLSSISVTDGAPLVLTAGQADADAKALALISHPQVTQSNGAILDLSAGSVLPNALAAGTDVVFQTAGNWLMGGGVATAGTAFDFQPQDGGVPVLQASCAGFAGGTHIWAATGYAGELIASGTTAFAGDLWSGGSFILDIESNGGTAQFNNSGSLMVAGGVLTVNGTATAVLNNAGTILGAFGQMTIGTALDNSGLVEVGDSARLTISGAVTNETTGQIILSAQYQNDPNHLDLTGSVANNGQIIDSSGILTIDGAVSGTGRMVLGDGAEAFMGGTVEVELRGAVATGQHISFAGGQGLLKLDDVADFHGVIDNFHFKDLIDLSGVLSESTTYNAASGALTVLSGATQVAQFTLTGGAPLNAFSDGHGGTLLSVQPYGTPAQLVQVMTQGTVAGDPALPNWSSTANPAAGYSFTQGGGWSFTATGTPIVTYSLGSGFTAVQSEAIANALTLWSSACNIQFQAAPAGTVGRIDFQISTHGLSDTVPRFDAAGNCTGNTVYLDTVAACWADFSALAGNDPSWGNSGFTAVLHEIGHAIGLDHPGAYAATCYGEISQQLFYTDSQQYSVMSYFEGTYTGAQITLPAGVNLHPQTPMMDDILAVQSLYGANTQTLAGNQTFGFNSSFGPGAPMPIREYDFNQNTMPFVTLWSGGGNNTLDLSGFAQNATVNLNPGSFSSVAGFTGNLGIAYGTRIDHAIGGPGDDSFTVNTDADVIDGGGGTNTVIFAGSLGQYSVGRSGNVVTVSSHGIIDTLTNIQTLKFADTSIATSSMAGGSSTATTANTPGSQATLIASDANSTVTGNGYDVLNLSQNPIASASSAYTIASNHDGSFNLVTTGSSDHVTGAMQIQFADKTVTIAGNTSMNEYVALLYQGAFGRTPDAPGLAAWEQYAATLPPSAQAEGANGLWDPALYGVAPSIAAGFVNSAEFQTKYGSLNNTQFVTQMYANVLDRQPDAAGLNAWVTAMNGGVAKAQALVGFADSAEAVSNATIGFTGQSGVHTSWLSLT